MTIQTSLSSRIEWSLLLLAFEACGCLEFVNQLPDESEAVVVIMADLDLEAPVPLIRQPLPLLMMIPSRIDDDEVRAGLHLTELRELRNDVLEPFSLQFSDDCDFIFVVLGRGQELYFNRLVFGHSNLCSWRVWISCWFPKRKCFQKSPDSGRSSQELSKREERQ